MKPEDFGWAYTTPAEPSKECRWCHRENVTINGVIVCVNCDNARMWPSQVGEQ